MIKNYKKTALTEKENAPAKRANELRTRVNELSNAFISPEAYLISRILFDVE